MRERQRERDTERERVSEREKLVKPSWFTGDTLDRYRSLGTEPE